MHIHEAIRNDENRLLTFSWSAWRIFTERLLQKVGLNRKRKFYMKYNANDTGIKYVI